MDNSRLLPSSCAIGAIALGFGIAACSAGGDTPSKIGDGSGSNGHGGDDNRGSGTGGAVLGSGGGGNLDLGTGGSGDDCGTTLQVVVRDFEESHPDFEGYTGLNDVGCGMVQPDLGSDRKPVFASGRGTQKRVVQISSNNTAVFQHCEDWNGWEPEIEIESATTFGEWYNTGSNNTEVLVDIPLTEESPGTFVYDNSAFFPIDDLGTTPGQQHNFHFTSEIHLQFTYQAGQEFTFRGDDDLWVFVNDRLAMDLGGKHQKMEGTIDFDAQATDLGITPGVQYAMDIFHAERHTTESNFRIETNISCFIPVVIR